jgi:hypothetical protein
MAPQAAPVVDGRPCDRTHPGAMDESCREVDPTAVAHPDAPEGMAAH